MRVGKQARNLGFERSGIHDLAQRGIGGQWQQVAGYVKSPGPQGAVEGFLFHLRGASDASAEVLKHGLAAGVILSKERLDGLGEWDTGGRAPGKVGQVPAALAEILVAGGTLLAIPALFVDQDDGCQQR